MEEEYEVPSPHQHAIEEAGERKFDRLAQKIALMTAVLATIGALISYQSGSAQNEAMFLKNQSILKQAFAGKFDLVLLDVMLPDMSGWDIFRTLSNKNYISKFVFLSVIPVSTERMQELQKAGISDYITKPFNKKGLVDRINKVLM